MAYTIDGELWPLFDRKRDVMRVLKREIEAYNWLESNMEKIFDLLSKLNRLVTVAKYSIMFDDAFSGRILRDNTNLNSGFNFTMGNHRTITFRTLVEAKERLIDEIISEL